MPLFHLGHVLLHRSSRMRGHKRRWLLRGIEDRRAESNVTKLGRQKLEFTAPKAARHEEPSKICEQNEVQRHDAKFWQLFSR